MKLTISGGNCLFTQNLIKKRKNNMGCPTQQLTDTSTLFNNVGWERPTLVNVVWLK